jgi:hypothetical protein
MDPLSALVTALALGATVIFKTTTEQIVKDAYATLKNRIRTRYGAVSSDLDQLEQAPDSKSRRAVIEEGLGRAGAQQDPEFPQLAAQAQALMVLIQSHAPRAAAAIGVDLKEVEAANLRLADIAAAGTGVKIEKGRFSGDIDIKGVRAGVGTDDRAPTA